LLLLLTLPPPLLLLLLLLLLLFLSSSIQAHTRHDLSIPTYPPWWVFVFSPLI
jgi:small-conductance mechanosensitive channel